MDGKPVVNADGLNASAAIDEATGDIIVKVANLSPYSQTLYFALPAEVKSGERITLHSDNPVAENTLDAPETIVPVYRTLDFTPVADPDNAWLLGVRRQPDGSVEYSERLGGRTFAVYRFHRN